MKLILIALLVCLAGTKVIHKKDRNLWLLSSSTVAKQRQQLRQRFDKLLGQLVKDKIQNYTSQENFVTNEDYTLRDIKELYEDSVKDIRTTEQLVESQMDQLYYLYVRRDPFRSYYNY